MDRRNGGIEIRDGTIRLSFYYEGRRIRRTLYVGDKPLKATPPNLKHAARLAEEIRGKITAGTFVLAEYFPDDGEGGPTTVTKQLDTWLASQRVEKSTKAGYEAAANFWRTASYHDTDQSLPLGPVPLRALKVSHIKTALARRPELSGKTINNYVSVLRGALQLAIDDKIITASPVGEVPSAKWQKEPPDPFTPEERDRIIDAADAKHPGQVANMVRFWMWSGLRTSELLGLRWPNVDLASGTVLVREAKVKAERKATKTNVARTVRLHSQALAALTAQKAQTYLKGEEVFQDPRHREPWATEASFRKVFWIPLLKGLGIRYRRPYQCRHTYATTLLMAGRNPAWCAKQLGHDVKVFLTTYARWIEGDADDREMAALEAATAPDFGTKVGTKQGNGGEEK
jgi:integrase